MRITRLSLALAAAMPLLAGAAFAQAPAAADPVVAKVNGQEIHLSEITMAQHGLPEQIRSLPQEQLYTLLLDQLVDQRALVLLAKKKGVDKDPAVALQMQRGAEQALQNALISKDVGPLVTDAALKAKYDRDYAGKPGEEEVHARHILVPTEVEAKQVIAELKKGGDFAAIAKQRSTDPGAAQGGDLGFFKKGEMVPEFANAAFGLKPGQFTETPVKTQYGWHIIRLEERRASVAAAFEQVRDEMRNKAIQDGIESELAAARVGLQVERFNADGTPLKATDGAAPPPAPAKL